MYRTAPFQNPATARTAGSCERTGATKAPVLSPAPRRRKLHTPRFRPKGVKTRSFRCSSSPQRTRFAGLRRGPQLLSSAAARTAAQIRPETSGRGRDSAPPVIGPHSGPQAVTRGFPAPVGVLPPAGALWPTPVLPAGGRSAGRSPPGSDGGRRANFRCACRWTW